MVTAVFTAANKGPPLSAAPKHQPHGRRIRCPGGYRAYVPEPLPPRFEWSAGLAAALSAADRAVGRLAGEGRRLPNPHLLIRPFVRREAVLSSRIEGTQATLGELLAAEAGAAVARSPADLREVANYVVALEYGVERLRTLPLSLRLVRELHQRLMRGARGDAATPGGFRRRRTGSARRDARSPKPPSCRRRPTASWSASAPGRSSCTTTRSPHSFTPRWRTRSSKPSTPSSTATGASDGCSSRCCSSPRACCPRRSST